MGLHQKSQTVSAKRLNACGIVMENDITHLKFDHTRLGKNNKNEFMSIESVSSLACRTRKHRASPSRCFRKRSTGKQREAESDSKTTQHSEVSLGSSGMTSSLQHQRYKPMLMRFDQLWRSNFQTWMLGQIAGRLYRSCGKTYHILSRLTKTINQEDELSLVWVGNTCTRLVSSKIQRVFELRCNVEAKPPTWSEFDVEIDFHSGLSLTLVMRIWLRFTR